MDALARSNWLHRAGVVLIAVTGAIHLVATPQYAGKAPYLGVLFAAAALLSVVAAVGIACRARDWGWTLGLIVAAGTIAGYILSRTTGLPDYRDTEWRDPVGLVALADEAAFIGVALGALLPARQTAKPRQPGGRREGRSNGPAG